MALAVHPVPSTPALASSREDAMTSETNSRRRWLALAIATWLLCGCGGSADDPPGAAAREALA